MKRIRFQNFGPPAHVVQCELVADESPPAAWEVVVDVLAFTINPSDLAILAGQYGTLPTLPATPGMEAVGRVRACGSSVRGMQAGDDVLIVGNECWTQRRRLPATAVFPVPPGLDLCQLAVLKVNAATAWLLLEEQVHLKRGEWVLQTAPLSSVGRAVIQLSKHMGYRTVNVVRRADAIDEVKALGGDAVVLDGPELSKSVAQATRQAPLRLALDAVGGVGIERLADCLARHGTIVNYGMLTLDAAKLRLDQLIFRGITLKGFWLSDRLNRMPLKERESLFGTLIDLLSKGVLNTRIAPGEWGIDDIAAAIRYAEQPNRAGKVVVFPHGTGILTSPPGTMVA